ncbi:MAG: hypothetical protein ACT4PV_09900 [Planctomycetaceae bacterium]
MALHLRPRRGPFETKTDWAAARPDFAAPAVLYAELLRCPRRDREEAVRYLVRRGIPEGEARALGVAFLGDYGKTAARLVTRFGFRALARAGLLSRKGHLIFYRHRILLPVREAGMLVAIAGRSVDPALRPATLLPYGFLLTGQARRALSALLALLREAPGLAMQLPLAFAAESRVSPSRP